MTDEFIIEELRKQVDYWMCEVVKKRNELADAEGQLALVQRLLFVMGKEKSRREANVDEVDKL